MGSFSRATRKSSRPNANCGKSSWRCAQVLSANVREKTQVKKSCFGLAGGRQPEAIYPSKAIGSAQGPRKGRTRSPQKTYNRLQIPLNKASYK